MQSISISIPISIPILFEQERMNSKQYNKWKNCYNMMNLNWVKEQENAPYEGEQKQGYSLTYIPHLQSLLLYGGSLVTRNHDIYLYHLINKQWTAQKTATPKPAPRKYHTAYYQKSIKALIVYGGQTQKGRSLDTFDILFIEDWRWKKLLFKVSIPPARHYHSFTPISNGNFLIFGGIVLPYGTFLQDLWVVKGIDKLKDTKTLQIAGCSCSELTGKGNPPPARFGHRSHYHVDTFYVFGGQSSSQQQNFTVYSLNLRSMLWNKHLFNMNLSQIKNFSLLKNPSNIDQIMIFGGVAGKKKANNHIYSLTLQSGHAPKIKKNQKLPQLQAQIDLNVFNNCCELPFNEVCGICCTFDRNQNLVMYRVQITQQTEELGLEEYLKYIKNQQLLSQQLIGKVSNLQALYQQIQIYISKLFKQYQQSGQLDQQIQKEKKVQIQACLQLKNQYLQIQQFYLQNLQDLKKARKDLAEINQHFQGYIQTERDQDQQ